MGIIFSSALRTDKSGVSIGQLTDQDERQAMTSLEALSANWPLIASLTTELTVVA